MAGIDELIARPPAFDYNRLADPLEGYMQGRSVNRQLQSQQALSGGLPKGPDGQVDWKKAVSLIADTQARFGNPAELAALAKAQQSNFYGTPIYGTDANGKPVIGTFDHQGNWKQIDTPGVTVTPGIKTIDTGTGTQIIDSRSGNPIGAPPGAQPPSGRMPPAQPPLNPNLPNGGRGVPLDVNSEGIPPSQAARVNAPQVGSSAPIQPTPVQTQPAARPGFIPKDIEGKEAAEARGQARGKAQANYPQIVSAATTSLRLLDEAISHPGREIATGASRIFDPRNYEVGAAVTGNRSAFDFDARGKQLEGRVFLDAFEQLRGGGAITEAEGNKATAAHARLMRSQSDDEYLAALKELRGIVSKGVKVARLKAAGRFDQADRELGLQAPDVEVTATGGRSNIDDLVKKWAPR